MEFLNKEKAIAIVDVDDVIIYTTALWYDRIFNLPDIFEKYVDKNQLLIPYNYNKNFMYNYSRPTYLFSDWLLKKNLTPEEWVEGDKLIMDIVKDSHFYDSDKLLPSNMLFGIKFLISNNTKNNLEKVIFVTRGFPSSMDSKIKLIREYYKDVMGKIDIITVGRYEKKSEAIQDYKDENIALLIDDEVHNIVDYLENCPFIKNCNILIPKYGYNYSEENMKQLDKALVKAIKNNNEIQYYDTNHFSFY